MTKPAPLLTAMALMVTLAAPGQGAGQGAGEPYPHGPLPEGLGCADCHSTEAWSPLDPDRTFEHERLTGFPLSGRHEGLSCRACHEDLRFSALDVAPESCGSCHLDVHQGTLSADCSQCHTPEGFSLVSGIQIHLNAGFPLQGAHLQVTCETCHSTDRGGAFSPIPSECIACHREEFEAPKAVDHVTLGFPEDCAACHTPDSWKGVASFDHAGFSGGFGLIGVHAQLPCGECHVAGGALRFPTPTGPEDCYGCHQSDYQQEHGGEGYPTDCSLCHSPDRWEGAEDDHAALSGGFVLEGAHRDTRCTSCHTPAGDDTLFDPAGPGDCVACHQADYQREHAGSGIPNACATCHNTSNWEEAENDHAVLSGGFVLEGAHHEVGCTSCHTPDGAATLFNPSGPGDCMACHQAEFQSEHAGSGYPEDCTTCHTVNRWDEVSADHEILSGGFVLQGAHDALDCSSCHIVPGFQSIFSPTDAEDCLACHSADYQREHSGSGYPGTCLTCHTVNSWEGAVFDHDGAFFPIYSGPHSQQWSDCSACHMDPTDFGIFSCLTCHDHSKTQTDADHSEVPDYLYESGQCLSCHPSGRSG